MTKEKTLPNNHRGETNSDRSKDLAEKQTREGRDASKKEENCRENTKDNSRINNENKK